MEERILEKDLRFQSVTYDPDKNRVYLTYTNQTYDREYTFQVPKNKIIAYNTLNVREYVDVNDRYFEPRIGKWVYGYHENVCPDECVHPIIRESDRSYQAQIFKAMRFLKADRVVFNKERIIGYRKDKIVFSFEDREFLKDIDECIRYGNYG